jgi:squalene cyclase
MYQTHLTKPFLQRVVRAGLEHLRSVPPSGVKNVSRMVQALCGGGEDASVYVRWLIEAKQDTCWLTDKILLDTARAASALAEYGIVFPDVKNWLLGQQQADGSWGDATETCYVLIALADMGEKNPRGCRWLVNCSEFAFSGTNALAVTALCRQGFDAPDFVAERVALLEQRQLSDGSWKSLAITNMVVQALFAAGRRETALRGVEWLVSLQGEDGSWRGKQSDNTALTLITVEMALRHL